jgi:hypothetical protein
MSLEDFIFSHPAQIALLGIQFQWTADTQVGAGIPAAALDTPSDLLGDIQSRQPTPKHSKSHTPPDRAGRRQDR